MGVGGITYAGGNVSVATSEEAAEISRGEGLSRPPSALGFVTRGARRGRKRLQLQPPKT